MTCAAISPFPLAGGDPPAERSAAGTAGGDYVSGALVRALEQRRRPGADVDGALALFVRRARAEDQPVERMLVALRRLLAAAVRPLAPDDDPAEVTALLLRRAITEYYRGDR